jgi:predicted nuclease of predicted toxin-antitoxin system
VISASFLLDANLSPKVGRFLTRQLQLDVVSLQGKRLGQLPDHEVVRMARSTGRVIITLDGDFAEFFYRTSRPDIGIIYLDLPNPLRTNPEINRLLAAFFRQHAEGVDLDHSLVVITEHEVRIVRAKS